MPNGAMKRKYASVLSGAVDGIGNVTVTGTREVVHQCATCRILICARRCQQCFL